MKKNNMQRKIKASLTQVFEPVDVCKAYSYLYGNLIKHILSYKQSGKALYNLNSALKYIDLIRLDIAYVQRKMQGLLLVEPIKIDLLAMATLTAIKAFKEHNYIFDALVSSDGSINDHNFDVTEQLIKYRIDGIKKAIK